MDGVRDRLGILGGSGSGNVHNESNGGSLCGMFVFGIDKNIYM